jgi:WD40 repeat protein
MTKRWLGAASLASALAALSLAPTHARQAGTPQAKPAATPQAKPAATRQAKPAGTPQDAKDTPAPKWDVAADLGPVTKLAFDTDEGTWMNVDVSPDGKRIVFDLLGDIYIMSIDGSGAAPATRLTSGPVFDMQPRFSPDGRRIALTSDRDGLWNIWTMDVEGKDARQVSREKRWFVNSPTWSPDGQYILCPSTLNSKPSTFQCTRIPGFAPLSGRRT